MSDTKTLTIGERRYDFGTIPPFQAIKVQLAVAKVIGEPLFKAFMQTKSGGDAEDAKAAQMQAGAAAIGLMLSKMDADELITTMETVFQFVSVDGKRADINQHFVGRNKELWQVFIGALRHNFSDFMPAGLFDSFREGMPAA